MTINPKPTPAKKSAPAWRLPLLAWLALHLCASAMAQQAWYWEKGNSTLNADITGIAAGGGGEFRFVNTAGKFVSSDSTGRNWTERANVAELADVFWDGTSYLVCGASGGIYSGSQSLAKLDKNPVGYKLNAITKGGGRIVVVGNDKKIRYHNGSNWANTTPPGAQNVARLGATYGAGRFVVVGQNGVSLWSDNGVNWTLCTGTGGPSLNAVAWANGLFVAVGDGGTVVTSSDGKSFSPGTKPTTAKLNGITYGTVAGQGYWVAVSSGEEVFATTNPRGAWTQVGSGLGSGLLDVAINSAGTVVAVGRSGNIRVSNGPLVPSARFNPEGPISQPAAGVKAASVGVTPGAPNVAWEWEATVGSNPGNMLTLLDVSSGKVTKTGPANLRYDLAGNSAEARSARIEIRQKGSTTVLVSLIINQAGADRLDLSKAQQSVTGSAGSYTLTVGPSPAFAWKAVVNPPQGWVTVAPASGSGQQNVTVAYTAFTSATANRSATIEFRRAADEKVLGVHTLTQSGLAPPAAAAWGWAPRNIGNDATWVAVQAGAKGWLAHSSLGRVDISSGGEVGWRTTIPAANSTRVPAGAFFDGRNYITVGDNLQVHFSEDPEAPDAQWPKKFSKTTKSWADGRLNDIASNGQRYVAVGRVTAASGGASEELVLTSANGGATWDRVDLNPNGAHTLYGVATYPNGPFVAVGSEGKIRYSALDGKTWTRKDAGGTDFRGVAYGAGRFVAVGLSGKVQYSDDGGVNWKTDVVGVAAGKDLRAITYGKAGDGVSYFVAVGNGVIQSSVDGASWFPASTGTVDLTDIEYRQLADGTGLFVGVGANGAIHSSRGPATGVAFTAPAVQPSTGGLLEVGIATTSGSWSAYSLDSWITLEVVGGKSGEKLRATIAPLGEGALTQRSGAIVFNNGTPTTGVRMVVQQNPVARFDAAVVRDYSLVGAAGASLTASALTVVPSTTDWSVSATGVPAWLRVEKLSATSARFTALSENATTAPRLATLQIVYSEAGRLTTIGTITVQQLPKLVVPKENWGWVDLTPKVLYSKATKKNVNAQEWISGTWNAVTHGGTKWIAVSESGRVATAERLEAGTQWTLHDLDSAQTFRDVAWDGSGFGIVGSRRVRFSEDDSANTFRSPAVNVEEVRFESIAHNGGRYVAVGGWTDGKGAIYGAEGSADAKWKNQNIDTQKKLWAVEYGANRFVAVGEDGAVWHSPTGHSRDWASVPLANRQNNQKTLRSVCWNGRQFLAAGANGTVCRSADGLSWNAASPAQGIPADLTIKGVTYGAGFYLAVGETANDRPVPIYASLDGSYWTEASVEKYKLRSISFEVSDYKCSLVPGVFVVVGEQGKLLVSYGPGNYNTLTGPTAVALGAGERSPGSVLITALAPWTATVSDAGNGVNWLKLKYSSGSPCQPIEFESVSANDSGLARVVDVVIGTTAGVPPLKVRVTQAPAEVEYDVTPDWRRVVQKGTDFDLFFGANRAGVLWAAAPRNPDWLTVGARNSTTGKVKITAKANPLKDCRVSFIDFSVNSTVVASVKIVQYGTDNRCTECETRDLLAK